jgi:eukaryotic-like serine/threonine-protein kinase
MAVEKTAGAGMPDDLEGILRIGDLVGGKLVVEGVLGVGGMGIVLAARHQQLGQKVAIKLLRPATAKHPEAVNRFLREARAAANLQSAHVVRVIDVGTLENGMPYMVMEHLAGSDLSALLDERGPLPVAEAVDYVLQGLEAVAEAHTVGLVHRDLKPANMFLTRMPDGAHLVKVLDFGISKAVQGGGNDPSLTATSAVLGSPMYMSPEQLRSSKNVDARTDIWAVGVILYQLVSGRYPFEDETVTGLCARIAADPPAPLRAHRADLPVPFDAVVMRCLEKDMSRRVQSVSELAAALRPFASAEGQFAVDRIARIGGPAPPPPVSSAPVRVESGRGTAFVTSDAVTATQAAPTNPPRAGRSVRLAIGASVLVVGLIGTFIALRSWPAARTPEHASVGPPTAATVPTAPSSIAPPAPSPGGAGSSQVPTVASSTAAPAVSAPPASSARPTPSRAPGRPGAAPAASATKSSEDLFLERK